jgi:general secretion pathway protein I
LVALAILTLSLGVLYQSFGLGLNTTNRAKDELEASALAESVLDRVGADLPLRKGELSGSGAPDFNWRVVIAPYDGTGADPNRLAAFRVTLFITQPQGAAKREWRIETLRIGANAE